MEISVRRRARGLRHGSWRLGSQRSGGEAAAALVFEAARVTGYSTIGPLVDAFFVTDTASELASFARRLGGRDLRVLGDFYAAATIVKEVGDATLVRDADCANIGGEFGRGSSGCSVNAPAPSGC